MADRSRLEEAGTQTLLKPQTLINFLIIAVELAQSFTDRWRGEPCGKQPSTAVSRDSLTTCFAPTFTLHFSTEGAAAERTSRCMTAAAILADRNDTPRLQVDSKIPTPQATFRASSERTVNRAAAVSVQHFMSPFLMENTQNAGLFGRCDAFGKDRAQRCPSHRQFHGMHYPGR
jgi:hypothetical protein